MIPKRTGNQQLSHFDVLVIGSGAGGASAASVLAQNGKRVLVLEAGSNYFEGLDDPDPTKLKTHFSMDELKMLQRSLIMPNPTVEPRTFRKSVSSGTRTHIGDVNHMPKTVGGSGVHADLKTPRFMPMDFRMRSLLGDIPGANFADWPITYDELEPFYLYAERAMGVQGEGGSNPFEGPRSAPFPMKPGLGMRVSLAAVEGAKKLGYHPFPYPTAVTSAPYRGRAACTDCGFCGDYGCAISAKGSPAVTTLRDALVTGNVLLLSETRAVKLLTSVSRREITGVEALGPSGESVTYTADQYVLAASPIESTRLLLLSDLGGPGLGNSSGLVGRNITFHFQTLALGVFEERLHGHRGRSVTHGMLDFRGTPKDPKHPMGGIVEFGGACEPISEAQTYLSMLKMSGGKLRAMMKQSPLRDRLMGLLMQAEDAPQFTNRVDLDPEIVDLDGLPVPRLTFQRHRYELEAREFYKPKLLELLGAAGAKMTFVQPADDIPSSHHVMGPLRFGHDPKESVCDATGRFHDIGNLYAADGSLFPTASGMNPTLTIVALAARVGASMVNPQTPEAAIPAVRA